MNDAAYIRFPIELNLTPDEKIGYLEKFKII